MRRTTYAVAVIVLVCSSALAGPLAIYTVQPEYPALARASHIKGDGVFIMRVKVRTGLVKDVQIAHSTGSSILDAAAIRALKQWRFKPGSCPPIKVEQPKRKDPFAAEDSFVKLPVHFVMHH
jgi:TonB family protein